MGRVARDEAGDSNRGVEAPEANVLFSGSSPAPVAVNEVVFRMPGGVPAGDAVSLTVEMGGVVSKAVTIALKQRGSFMIHDSRAVKTRYNR